jgi:hypothetical protein
MQRTVEKQGYVFDAYQIDPKKRMKMSCAISMIHTILR